MSSLVLSLYLGYAVYSVFPFLNVILGNNTPAGRTILSIATYLVFCGLSWYTLKRLGVGGRSQKGAHAVILIILAAGFLLALGYHLFAIQRLLTLPPSVGVLFTDAYFFWWFIAPLVGLFLVA